jgi:hypothetical protein
VSVDQAQHDHHDADLDADDLHQARQVADQAAGAEVEEHEADVEQVEPDDEQLVDRVGERGVVREDVLEEHPAVAREGARDPDGQRHGDGEVGEVRSGGPVHDRFL